MKKKKKKGKKERNAMYLHTRVMKETFLAFLFMYRG